MAKIEEIIQSIQHYLEPTDSKPLETEQAIGRVVAEDVIAQGLFPPKTMVNVHGYAVMMSDLVQIPTTLIEIGKATASKPFVGEVKRGETVAVTPNAILPEGADMVIRKQFIEKNGRTIAIAEHIPLTTTISPSGMDVSENQIILKKGTILNAHHLALASMLRRRWLPVRRRPNIGIMTYHPSVEGVKENRHIRNIAAQVAVGVTAMVRSCGANPIALGKYHEDYTNYEDNHFIHDLELAMTDMDMIIGIGGVNYADTCPMWEAIRKVNGIIKTLDIGIGLGHKMITGHVQERSVLGLPSNPVAAMMSAELVVRPLIHRILGVEIPLESYRDVALLSHNLDSYDRNCDYIYGFLKHNETGQLIVTPSSTQDVLMLTELCEADCIVCVDKTRPLTSGTSVEIIRCGRKLFMNG